MRIIADLEAHTAVTNVDSASDDYLSCVDKELQETAITSGNVKEETSQLPWWKRTSVRNLLALLFVILLVFAILILTVFLKNDEYQGPQYCETNFDGLQDYDPSACTNEDCHGSLAYGSHVKLSADGNRLFVASLRNEGILKVWDNTNDTWSIQARILPHDPNYDGRMLHKNGTQVLNFDINEDGSRLVVSTKQEGYEPSFYYECLVRVFADEVDGWSQVGQSLDSFAVKLKTDNKTNEAYDWVSRIGMVQAFHLSNENGNGMDSWIPLGQPLFGEFEDDHLGKRMALARNGDHLVLSKGQIGVQEFTDFAVFDMVDGVWESYLSYRGHVFADDTLRESNVIALSQDGSMLAILESDHSPSAYSEKPYRGMIQIYKWQEGSQEFDRFDSILGEDAFQHLGTSLAFANDGNYILVVGLANTRSSTNPDGDCLDIFRMNSTCDWVERVGLSFGWSVNCGWNAVAISANGLRVVAEAESYPNKTGYKMYYTGTVRVFE